MFKTTHILTAVVLGLLFNQSSKAATLDLSCSAQGFTPGAACTGDAAWSLASSCTQINETRPCIVINCADRNECVCGYSQAEACGGGGGGGIICKKCPDPDTTWTFVRLQNYQQRISDYIQNALTCTCTPVYSYRCNEGYYTEGLVLIGNPPDCKRCPNSGFEPGSSLITDTYGTSDAGSHEITSCYLSSSTSFKDTKGTFKHAQNCYYTE